MATRTRYEYLKDLLKSHCLSFEANNNLRSRFSQLLKKPNNTPQISSPVNNINNTNIPGALSWKLSENATVALSNHYLLIAEKGERRIYKISELVAWEIDSLHCVVYTNKMERVRIDFEEDSSSVAFSKFLSTLKTPLQTIKIRRKNSLGFHIQNNCMITDVERNSPAALANIVPNSFVLRINGIETCTLRPQEMISLLKKSDLVELVLIGPGGVG